MQHIERNSAGSLRKISQPAVHVYPEYLTIKLPTVWFRHRMLLHRSTGVIKQPPVHSFRNRKNVSSPHFQRNKPSRMELSDYRINELLQNGQSVLRCLMRLAGWFRFNHGWNAANIRAVSNLSESTMCMPQESGKMKN